MFALFFLPASSVYAWFMANKIIIGGQTNPIDRAWIAIALMGASFIIYDTSRILVQYIVENKENNNG